MLNNQGICPNFHSIASSSKGNSYFVVFNGIRLLVDIGIGIRALENSLKSIGESLSAIDGIFITHEHTDHIKGLNSVYKKYKIPIYATKKTWEHLLAAGLIANVDDDSKRIINPNETIDFFGLKIKAFSIPHDATDPVGYSICYNDEKVVVCTDCGTVTNDMLENAIGADIILLEANHDANMLDYGSYPFVLKRRISSNLGHLSNVQAGLFLKDIITKKTKQIFLGHLSQSNNNPLVAYETVKHILLNNNIGVNEDGCPSLSIIY